MLTRLNTSFPKALSVLIAELLTALKRKRILWTCGSTPARHTPQFAKTDLISSGLQTYIWRVQTSTEVGSNPHFLHLLQEVMVHRISRLSLTAGLLTARAERCRSHSATVLHLRRLSTNTAQIFFACGLPPQIITQIFVSAPKFLSKFPTTTVRLEILQDTASAISMILIPIRIWYLTTSLKNLTSMLL